MGFRIPSRMDGAEASATALRTARDAAFSATFHLAHLAGWSFARIADAALVIDPDAYPVYAEIEVAFRDYREQEFEVDVDAPIPAAPPADYSEALLEVVAKIVDLAHLHGCHSGHLVLGLWEMCRPSLPRDDCHPGSLEEHLVLLGVVPTAGMEG